MATKKISLGGVRVSPDVYEKLKEMHRRTARQRHSTGNRITFSSWIEELLADYIRDTVKFKRAIANLDKMPDTGFE